MQILSCIFVIIGIIIGAGFASGKEIYTFFYIYGEKGIIGIIISSAIIAYVIYKSLKIILKYDINTYSELLKKAIDQKHKKTINIEIILITIINIFLLISFFVMCAGFSAYFKQEFGINGIYTSVVIAIISYIILNRNMKGIFILNSILIPTIIIFLIILGTKSFSKIGIIENSLNNSIWFLKSILYASYNCITLTALLIPMKKYIKGNKDISKISIITGLIIIILALIIVTLLSTIPTEIRNIDLPAVYASRFIWNRIQIFIWNYNTWRNNYNSHIRRFWLFK